MPNSIGSVLSSRLRAGQFALDQFRNQHSHVVMETSDRSVGFALFGGYKARHQLGRLYLPAQEQSRSRIVLHRPATAEYCRGLAQRFGMVVFCGDAAPPALAPELLSIPLLVDLYIQIPAVLEGPGAPWRRWAKDNIARIRKSRFEFDIQKGDKGVSEFHRCMFRPTMRDRHGAEAYLASRRQLATMARGEDFELIRVLQDGKWVAGCLNQHTPDGYRMCRLGWLNGDDDLLRRGVVSALYWFNLQRAAAAGHQRLQTGGVPPFLEDGLFLFKTRWGARLCDPQRFYTTLHLLLEPSHPACWRFLQAHDILATGSDQKLIVFSGRHPEAVDVTPAILSGIKRWYSWREPPLFAPEVTSDEVPVPLRPWLFPQQLPGSV